MASSSNSGIKSVLTSSCFLFQDTGVQSIFKWGKHQLEDTEGAVLQWWLSHIFCADNIGVDILLFCIWPLLFYRRNPLWRRHTSTLLESKLPCLCCCCCCCWSPHVWHIGPYARTFLFSYPLSCSLEDCTWVFQVGFSSQTCLKWLDSTWWTSQVHEVVCDHSAYFIINIPKLLYNASFKSLIDKKIIQ